MKNAALSGKPYAGNPHVRFDEGEVASAKPRRGSLLYKRLIVVLVASVAIGVRAESSYPNIAYDDTVTISTDQTGDSSVCVAGKLLVTGGKAAQTAGTTIALGSPADEEGCVKTPAAIVVAGGTFGKGESSDNVQLTLGADGGRGGVQVSGGKFAVAKYNISANAQTNDTGYIDYLSLSGASATVRELYNYSAYTARVVVAGTSTYATAHSWYGTMFQKGPVLFDCAKGSKLTFNISNTMKTFNTAGIGVCVAGEANVVFSLSGGKSNGSSLTLNSGARFENVGTVSFSGDSLVAIKGSDMFSSKVAKLSLSNVRLEFDANSVNEIHALSGDSTSSFSGSGTLALRPSSADDEMSVFTGSIDPASKLTLAKRGAGTSTATVSSGIVPKLKLEEGTLILKSDCTVSNLTAEAGTTLVADGCEVTVVGTIPTGIDCVERNGGRIVSVVSAGEGTLNEIRRSAWPANVDLVKTGDGELRLYDPDLAGPVHVKAGTLSFSRLGLRDRYLKFTIKEILQFKFNGELRALAGWRGRIYFYDTNDDLCTDTKSYNTKFALGTHPSVLTKGEVTAPADTVWKTVGDYTSPFFMFRTSGGNPCLWLTGVLTNIEDKVNFQVIYYRLPDPISTAIDGINVDTTWDYGNPKKWMVESSATGEDGSWQTILEKDEMCAGMGTTRSGPMNGDSTKSAYHFSYVQQGVQGLADALQVQVDEGATLDFTAKDGGQAIDAITIDFERGGGVLKGAKLAGSGTLYLVNATKDLLKLPLPLVLEDLGGSDNLKNWDLVIDGESKGRRLKYDAESGKLTVVPNGLMLLFR